VVKVTADEGEEKIEDLFAIGNNLPILESDIDNCRMDLMANNTSPYDYVASYAAN
jgi:hypothetical protein